MLINQTTRLGPLQTAVRGGDGVEGERGRRLPRPPPLRRKAQRRQVHLQVAVLDRLGRGAPYMRGAPRHPLIARTRRTTTRESESTVHWFHHRARYRRHGAPAMVCIGLLKT